MKKKKKFQADYLENKIELWTCIAYIAVIVGLILFPFTYGIGTVLCSVVASWCWRRRAVYVSGYNGERQVQKYLSQLLPKDVVIFHDVAVQNNGKVAQIDHLVVGKGGVMVLETKNHSGTVFVDPNQKQWRQVKMTRGGQTCEQTLYSPLTQNFGHKRAVQHVFRDAHLDGAVKSLVLFASNRVRLNYVEPTEMVKYLNELSLDDFSPILARRDGFSMETAIQALRKSFVQVS